MSHYKDLRATYAKRMEYHGVGIALFQPIAASDMQPPCCGYFDRNGDWNIIANLRANRSSSTDDYEPLEYEPTKVTDIHIEWQPKTSLGVTAIAADTFANTPDNLPGGADAHIKYASRSKFGAVLMTQKPITLTGFNQERLFLSWLASNRARLYERHGLELKKYGCWIVTRTYTAPGCSINAWINSDRSTQVSLKGKASMLGELGEDLSWRDKLLDKDWSHYRAKNPDEGLVVFMDGIEVKGYEWYLDAIRHSLRGGSSSPNRDAAAAHALPPVYEDRKRERPVVRDASRQRRDRPLGMASADESVLQDAGLLGFGRSQSLRRPSSFSDSVRSRSLRRETRSIRSEKEHG